MENKLFTCNTCSVQSVVVISECSNVFHDSDAANYLFIMNVKKGICFWKFLEWNKEHIDNHDGNFFSAETLRIFSTTHNTF